jgi:hypothetical protein
MLRLRHTGRLLRELFGYAVVNGAWWVPVLGLGLALLLLLVLVAQATAPVTLYPLF